MTQAAQTQQEGFASPITFAACSFLRPTATDRRKMVLEALKTWDGFLDLPFAERVFLDDRSPDFTASRLLASVDLLNKFDRIQYWHLAHPPHSNFGIVACLSLANTPYVLHLDDDVLVTMPLEQCLATIRRFVRVMEADPEILGIGMLNLPLSTSDDWKPSEVYDKDAKLYYPAKYFGTAACLIRRSLLDVVTLDQIRAWGADQPEVWEKLVSEDSRKRFLVSTQCPFSVRGDSYFVNAAGSRSLPDKAIYYAKRTLRRLGAVMGRT